MTPACICHDAALSNFMTATEFISRNLLFYRIEFASLAPESCHEDHKSYAVTALHCPGQELHISLTAVLRQQQTACGHLLKNG